MRYVNSEYYMVCGKIKAVQVRSGAICVILFFFFFQAEDGIRDWSVTGVQTCALPISRKRRQERERDGAQGHEREQRREREARSDLQAAVLVEPPEYMQDKAAQLLHHVGHGMRRSEA